MFDMLGNIMKNVVSKPATRLYPVEKREPFKDTRGHIDMDIDTCIFCGICSKKCPSNAINVNRNEKTWELNPYKCVICNVCVEVCPKKSIRNEEQYKSSAYTKETLKYVQQAKPVQEKPAAAAQPQAAAAKTAAAAEKPAAEQPPVQAAAAQAKEEVAG